MNQDTTKIESEVKVAVDSDPGAIADRVRAVTLDALSGGQLDAASIRAVITAVLKGAQEGVARPDEQRATALREAVRGVDEALAAAAQATQLAIQEAAGRTGEFSRQGLKTRLDELGSVESLFLETLAEAARSATGHAQETLRALAEHSRSSGTAVGGRVQAAVGQLAGALAGAAQEGLEAGARTLRNEAELFAGLAAGVLRGIADRLHTPQAGGAPRQGDEASGSGEDRA